MPTLDTHLSPEALQSLLDTMGEKSPALQEQLQNAKGAAYEDLFGKMAQTQEALAPELAEKSAADSATTLADAAPAVEEGAVDASKALVPISQGGTDLATIAGGGGDIIPTTGRDLAVLGGEGAESGLLSRLLGPAGLAYAALSSPPMESDEQELSHLPKKQVEAAALGVPAGASGGGNVADKGASSPLSAQNDNAEDNGQSTPNTAATIPPKAKQDYLQGLIDQLTKQLNNGSADADLKNAQDNRTNLNFIAGLQAAGQQLGAALSRGAIKPDYTNAASLQEMGNQGIQNVQQRQQLLMSKIEQGVKLSDLQDKQEMRDSDSKVSEAYRTIAEQLNPKLAQSATWKTTDAETVAKLMPMVDMSIKMQAMQSNKAFQNSIMQDNKFNQNEQKYAAARNQLYSPRGAAGRAAQVIQASQKLQALSGMYKNGDDIPPPLMQSAAADFATIMQNGGMPHENELRTLMPSTLTSKISSLGSMFTSNPSGAGMGKYMDLLSNTAKELQNSSQKYIQDHENFTLNGFKNSLRPDFYGAQKDRVDSMTAPQAAPEQSYTPQIQAFRQAHPESKLSDQDIISALKQYSQ